MKNLLVEFSVWTTIYQLPPDNGCMALLGDALWCATYPARMVTLRTRLLMLTQPIPDSFVVPPMAELSSRLGVEVTYATTTMLSVLAMMFIDACVTFVVFALCILAVKYSTKCVAD